MFSDTYFITFHGVWQGMICVSFVLAQTWQLLLWVSSPSGETGQEWTAPHGLNLWKKHVLVVLGHVDFPWFVSRAVRLLCYSVLSLLLCTSRSYMYGWTCTTVFLISFRKFPNFLSKASTFSPVIRISSVFLFIFYSKVNFLQWTWQYWFLLLPFTLQSA